MANIKVVGLDKLEKQLKKNATLGEVKQKVKKHGSELQKKAQRNCNFRGHYEYKAGVGKIFVKPTGKLQESIGLDIQDNGLSAVVEPMAEYAAYVELGTRFMDKQPFVKPALEEVGPKFKSDMQKLVK